MGNAACAFSEETYQRNRYTAAGGNLNVVHKNGWTTRTRTGPLGIFQRKATRYTGVGENPSAVCNNPSYAFAGHRNDSGYYNNPNVQYNHGVQVQVQSW